MEKIGTMDCIHSLMTDFTALYPDPSIEEECTRVRMETGKAADPDGRQDPSSYPACDCTKFSSFFRQNLFSPFPIAYNVQNDRMLLGGTAADIQGEGLRKRSLHTTAVFFFLPVSAFAECIVINVTAFEPES